ncbi:hypothetical protein CROQUDRAFT_69378 [Cronartium quercuum f. sp. fusiforme G11]|uniref:Uncharacterized protein n=1 Tax=Cronartium quercuum f. sp. fusiforme G11 TaxID=708437 RepID=A0A9P6NAH4_9BASI|nr:hypothetical protein CROQUDRAFT_69378 [Cronartium quercuum f. sp. fusiforme G11]
MDTRHIPHVPVPDCMVMFRLHTSLSMHLLQRRPGKELHLVKDHRAESEVGCEQLPSLIESRSHQPSSCSADLDSHCWSHRPTHSLVCSGNHSPQSVTPSTHSPDALSDKETDPDIVDPSVASTTSETLKSDTPLSMNENKWSSSRPVEDDLMT